MYVTVQGVSDSIITLVQDVGRYQGFSADVDVLQSDISLLSPVLEAMVHVERAQ